MVSANVAPALHEATLFSRADAGGGLVRVSVAPPASLATTFECPGQYVLLRVAGKSSYYVLSNDVGDTKWELLVRPVGEVAISALDVPLGDAVEVSAALGSGFPMEDARGRALLIVVTGSGIAAARPVVRARLREHEALTTELLVGVRTRSEIPLLDELKEWSRARIRVTVCLSREEVGGIDGYAAGYVQDVARATSSPSPGRMIFAAGVKGMVHAIRSLARELGSLESDVRTNY
jgi:sulfhydrogenase subunit gamma (sulfur reductase)